MKELSLQTAGAFLLNSWESLGKTWDKDFQSKLSTIDSKDEMDILKDSISSLAMTFWMLASAGDGRIPPLRFGSPLEGVSPENSLRGWGEWPKPEYDGPSVLHGDPAPCMSWIMVHAAVTHMYTSKDKTPCQAALRALAASFKDGLEIGFKKASKDLKDFSWPLAKGAAWEMVDPEMLTCSDWSSHDFMKMTESSFHEAVEEIFPVIESEILSQDCRKAPSRGVKKL